MSDELPSTKLFTEEEERDKKAVMKYMSGEDGLEVFCERLRERGIALP